MCVVSSTIWMPIVSDVSPAAVNTMLRYSSLMPFLINKPMTDPSTMAAALMTVAIMVRVDLVGRV